MSLRVQLWISLAGAATVIAVVVGCGDSETNSSTTEIVRGASGATGAPGASAENSSQPPKVPGPEEIVTRYYELVDERRYDDAWPLLPASVQAESGGFEQWRAGYDTTISTSAHSLQSEEAGRTATVTLSVSAVDRDVCGERVEQEFAGSWTLERGANADWSATDTQLKKVSGKAPVLDASTCASPQGPEQPAPPAAPASSCTPGYSPCLTPASDYDCDNGTGDGPRYTGEVSVSGSDPYDLDADGDGIACNF